MRISDSQRYGGLVPRYQDLLARQIKVQQQIASGIRIQNASDAPGDAARSHLMHTTRSTLEQNLRNLDEGQAWTEQTNNALNQAVSIVQRMDELSVRAGDVTLGAAERANIAQEVDQLLEGMLDVGAQTYRGRTILSGTQTGQPAFTATRDAQGRITAVTYQGNGEDRSLEVEPGRAMAYNLLGSNEAGGDFGALRDTAAGVDLFDTAIRLRDFLLANDSASVTGISLPELKDALTHLTTGLARVGGLQSRMNQSELTDEDHLELVQKQLSQLIETDLAEAAVEASELDVAYRAALQVGSRIMQTSLLDYLR